MAEHNLVWVRTPVTWGMIPGLEDIICSIEVMYLGMVSKVFLIDPPERLPLVLHGLLWDLTNSQVSQGGIFLTMMSFLGIIPFLDNLMRYLKEQWFILWCQTKSSFLSRPKKSLVDHSLSMSFLFILDPTASLSTSSKLVGIGDGIFFGVMSSSPASSILPWPKIRIFRVSPQEDSFMRSSRVVNMSGSDPFWYITMSHGYKCHMEPSLAVSEVSDRSS